MKKCKEAIPIPGFFAIFIFFFFVIFIFIIVSLIRQFIQNENSPVIATRARLIDKICDSDMHTDAHGITQHSETLYLIYELDTESTIKFCVGGRVYRQALQGEWGMLTLQGTRFLRFESARGIIEK